MEKQQEIEKIAKLLYWCCDDTDCNVCKYFDTDRNRRLRGCIEMQQAEKLYNANYRNADRIITRILCIIYEYFQGMDIDKRDIEQYTHTLDYMICKEFGLDKEV